MSFASIRICFWPAALAVAVLGCQAAKDEVAKHCSHFDPAMPEYKNCNVVGDLYYCGVCTDGQKAAECKVINKWPFPNTQEAHWTDCKSFSDRLNQPCTQGCGPGQKGITAARTIDEDPSPGGKMLRLDFYCQCPPPVPDPPAPSPPRCEEGRTRPCTNDTANACEPGLIEVCEGGAWSNCVRPCSTGVCKGKEVLLTTGTCQFAGTCELLDPSCRPECDPATFVGGPCGDPSCGTRELCQAGRIVCGQPCNDCESGPGFYRLVPGRGPGNECQLAPGCESLDLNTHCPLSCYPHLGESCAPPDLSDLACSVAADAGIWVCDDVRGGLFQCLAPCETSAECGRDGFTFWDQHAESCLLESRCEPLFRERRTDGCQPECPPGTYREGACEVPRFGDPDFETCGGGKQLCDSQGYWGACGLPCDFGCGAGLHYAAYGSDCRPAGQCLDVVPLSSGSCCFPGQTKIEEFQPIDSDETCVGARRCQKGPEGAVFGRVGEECTGVCRTGGIKEYVYSCTTGQECKAPEECNGCDDDLDGHSDEDVDIFDTGDPCSISASNACSSLGTLTCSQGQMSCLQCSGQTGPDAWCGVDPSGSALACAPACFSPIGASNSCRCGPTPETMTFSVAGPNEWPAGCWRPYSDASPFNQIVTDMAIDDLWQATNDFLYDGGSGPWRWLKPNAIPDAGNYGEPTYYVDPDSPAGTQELTIKCVSPAVLGFDGCRGFGAAAYGLNGTFHDAGIRVPLNVVPEGVPIPGSSENTVGSDKHLVVVDVKNRLEWDFWGVESIDGGVLLARSVDALPLDGPGYPSITTASAFGNLAGRVRAEELLAGEINHALAFNVACTRAQYLPPAAQCDMRCEVDCGFADDEFAPAMGDRFRLDMTVAEIDALTYADGSPFPEWKKIILRAMRRYGLIVTDTAGISGPELNLEFESGSMYSTFGKADKWVEFAQQNLAPGEWEYYQGVGDPYISNLLVADFDRGAEQWRHRLKLIESDDHQDCANKPPDPAGCGL